MRWQEKDLSNQLLQKYKKNIKATWNVLNKVVKNHNDKDFPTYIVKNYSLVIENIEEIVDEFSDFLLIFY